jgi:hypothetical protein
MCTAADLLGIIGFGIYREHLQTRMVCLSVGIMGSKLITSAMMLKPNAATGAISNISAVLCTFDIRMLYAPF